MSTYGEMQDRIADELARSDLTTAIQRAIQTAIKRHERRRFYFNEAIGSFSASSSQEYYTTSDFAPMDRLVSIDSLKIDVNTSTYPIIPRSWEYIDKIQTNAGYTGDPTDYVYYRQQIRLYPIPYIGRTLHIAYVERLATLSATADTNAWMMDAEEMIRAAAKREIYMHKIQKPDKALAMEKAERDALLVLEMETEGRIDMSVLPTAF